MKNKKITLRTAGILMVALMLLAATGCTTFDNFRHTFFEARNADESTIRIGVYEPKTGSLSRAGQEEIKGIELAHSIYNNVRGMKVELFLIDNQSDVNTSRAAIENLVEMHPVAIIGSAGEAASMIASPYIKEAKIPTITPSAINPLITENNGYYFRACITEDQKGEGLAEYAVQELGANKVGILTIANDNAIEAVADGFRHGMKESSPERRPVVFDVSIAADDLEMKGLIRRIENTGCEAIFMPVGVEKADLIFTMVEEAGLTDLTFLGDQAWKESDFIRMMKKHPDIRTAFPSDNIVTENSDTTDVVTAETKRFLIEYANRYGYKDAPTENTALGYDAYLLIMNAINRADSLEGKDIRRALSNTENIRCATGVFRFDKDGNPVRTVNISTIKDDQVVNLYNTSEVYEAEEMKKADE